MSTSTSQPQQYAKLKKYLTGIKLTFTDEWLEACYEWLTDSHSSSQLTDDFAQNQAYLQWLDVNLEEMESICLPPNLKEQRLMRLEGVYALQVNYVQDIGESAYNQYNKIKKLENENVNVQATDSTAFIASWQPKQRRCLYLSLTDGSQKIHGMELEQIQTLSLAIKPGCKILINGPVDCRRGILHLRTKNVKILGGEVEALLTENSVEKVLTKVLNKKQDQTTAGRNPRQLQVENEVVSTRTQSQSSIFNRTTQRIESQNQSTTQPIPTTTTQRIQTQPPPTLTPTVVIDDEFMDDEFLMGIDEEALLASSQISQSSSVPNQQPFVTTALAAPYQYIKQITCGQIKHGIKVPIKGIIATLTSNIQVDKTTGEWKLSVNVNDGSGYLIARIAPAVLDRIIGFSPSQMKQLKTSKTATDRAKVGQGMINLTSTLVHFSGILEIQISQGEKLITAMHEITNDHVLALANRTDRFFSP